MTVQTTSTTQLVDFDFCKFNTSWKSAREMSKFITVENARTIYKTMRAIVVSSGKYNITSEEFDSWVLEDMMNEMFQDHVDYITIPTYMHWVRFAAEYIKTVKTEESITVKVSEKYFDYWMS